MRSRGRRSAPLDCPANAKPIGLPPSTWGQGDEEAAMVQVVNDVVFGDAGSRPLKLDVYEPDGQRRATAAILVHGGGWVQGSKAMLAEHARHLARDGFTVFVPEYRLTPEAPWPAQIH